MKRVVVGCLVGMLSATVLAQTTEEVPTVPGSDEKSVPVQTTEEVPTVPGSDEKPAPVQTTEEVPTVPGSDEKPAQVQAMHNLAEVWATIAPAKLLDEAVSHRRLGDFEGAARRFEFLAAQGESVQEVAYHHAILFEMQENYPEAEARFLAIVSQWPVGPISDDARFRRAYCLEELGRHTEALDIVRRLQRAGRWSAADQFTMSLQRGIVELRSNRRRRGIRRILATLETLADSGKLTWIRAKARLALVRVQLSEAATLTLTGNRRAARHLAERDSLITVAEKQAVVMFRLNEPEFALEGLLLLGDAYMVLYEDMLSYPPPRTIPPEDHAAYRMLVAQKAQVLKLKAYNRYDEGIRVGLRTRWMGSIMETLATRRDAIGPRAQSSDEPSPETAAPQGAPESD